MRRAVLYLRVSSEKQTGNDKTSLELQESDCRKHAAREGWEVAGVYQDVQTAHDTLADRPGLQQVREVVKNRQAEIVLCWATSRIMRDSADLAIFAREVYEVRGQIVSVTEGLFDDTPTGKLLLSIYGWKDEQERITIRDRLHGNMRAKVEKGRIKPGPTPPYGYVFVGENKEGLAINEEVAPVVRFIFQSIDDGMSLHGVAKALNEMEVLTPSRYLDSQGLWPEKKRDRLSGNWRRQSITYLIANPVYCGRYAAYRHTTVKNSHGKMVPRVLDETDERRIELPGLVPEIVTPEQWERVQTAVRDRTLSPAPGPDDQDKPLLLNGIGVCGVCGGRVTSLKHHSTGAKGYICTLRANRVGPLQDACHGGSWMLPASAVDDQVWAQILEMAQDTATFQQMLDAPRRDAKAKLAEANRREKTIRAELERARKNLETISRRLGTEDDDAIYATLRQQYKDTERLISGLLTRLGQTEKSEDRLSAYLDGIAQAVGMLGRGPLSAGDFAADMARSVARASGLDDAATEAHMDKLMDDGTFANAAYQAGFVTREQKRTLLRAIGAHVLMYPVKHEYTQANNGKRWELVVIVSSDDNGGRYRRIVNGGK
jgi:DNA invertase Pin-like site-specific DNA recombinase